MAPMGPPQKCRCDVVCEVAIPAGPDCHGGVPLDGVKCTEQQRGEPAYADLTDVAFFPQLMRSVEEALQRLLGLLYTPRIRRLCERLAE